MESENRYENVELYNAGTNMVNSYNSPEHYPMHWHKIAEVAYLPREADSSIPHRVRVSYREYAMCPGDVVFIWPGQAHEILENPDKELVGFQFSLSELMEFLDFLPYMSSYRHIGQLRYEEDPELMEAMNRKLDEVLEYHRTRPRFFGVQMMKCIYDICILLADHIDKNRPGEGSRHIHSPEALEKINLSCTYIRSHLSEDLSLSTVAEKVGFSVPYYSRTFKSVMGVNFIDYVNYQRVRFAESMLAENLLPVTEICFKAGFTSIPNFNRIFKKVTGASPREFKHYHYIE
jgi:AraC-like DNA-binding protein